MPPLPCGRPAEVAPADRSALVVKLQILGALALPLVLITVWLGSKGFFQALPSS
jgi:hypothetical protein